ncbi:MAG TPA: hypothetical protein VMI06_13995 [Terriglobia bacterium]|nr:hypothetical protein [Terriglobia bacterium]
MHHNFVSIRQTVQVTPAMEAGVKNRLWTIDDLVGPLLEPVYGPRRPYKK